MATAEAKSSTSSVGTSSKKKNTKDASTKKPVSSSSGGTGGVSASGTSKSRPSSATTKKKSTSSTSSAARKKKDGTSSVAGGAVGTSSSNPKVAPSVLNAVATAAVKAERELQQARAETEARRNDAAWLRPDLITKMIERQALSGKPSVLGFLSDEAAIVDGALAQNAISRDRISPQAYGCLLEFSRKFACELVADAHDFAWHAGRSKVSASDLELAIEMRESSRPSSDSAALREEVQFMAEDLNRVPLPLIPSYCYSGIALPPQDEQLTARTFDVVSSAASLRKRPFSAIDGSTDASDKNSDGAKKVKESEPWASYGANKSKRITVTLESHSESNAAPPPAAPSALSAGETKNDLTPTTSQASPMDVDKKGSIPSPASGVERRAAVL